MTLGRMPEAAPEWLNDTISAEIWRGGKDSSCRSPLLAWQPGAFKKNRPLQRLSVIGHLCRIFQGALDARLPKREISMRDIPKRCPRRAKSDDGADRADKLDADMRDCVARRCVGLS